MKDFAKARYLALAKAIPGIKKERTQTYIMLSLTFVSLSFLGIFAINPTLTTIAELNKKLEDSIFVSEALKTKLANLSSLHGQYETMQSTLPIIEAAVPDTPKAAYVLAQMQAIARDTGVTVTGVQVFEVELTKKSQPLNPQEASFIFTITAEGETQQLLQFLQAATRFDRVIAIEAVTLTNEEKQALTIRAKAFFTP